MTNLLSPEAVEFAKDFGFPALLVVGLLGMWAAMFWTMSRRLCKGEDFIRETLVIITKNVTSAMRDCTNQSKKNTEVLRDLVHTLSVRTCQLDPNREYPATKYISEIELGEDPPTALHRQHG